MPPVLSRKRMQSDSPPPAPPPKRARAPKAPAPKPAPKPPARRTKQSVFDAPPKVNRTLSQTKKFLEGSDDDSELSDAESSDDEFEDVPLTKGNTAKGKGRKPRTLKRVRKTTGKMR